MFATVTRAHTARRQPTDSTAVVRTPPSVTAPESPKVQRPSFLAALLRALSVMAA